MSFFADIANIIFLIAAVLGGVVALIFHNRYAGVADRVSQLEAELQGRDNARAGLEAELSQRRKDIERLSRLAENAGVDRARLEEIRASETGKRPDKKKANEKLQRDTQRLRELEAQVDEARRQLELAQKQLKVRDADVRELRDEVESLQVALADQRPSLQAPRARDEDEQAPVAAPAAVSPAASQPPPQADIDALVQARTIDARKEVESAERVMREAQGRANLAELEVRRTTERLNRLDKRSHELLERLITTEREYRKVQRQVQDYQRMYMGLKGRFEVARDTLVTFRDKFNVEIPTEVGVPQFGPIEEFLEYDEEEERSRPRGADRRGGPGRERGPRGDYGRSDESRDNAASAVARDAAAPPDAATTVGRSEPELVPTTEVVAPEVVAPETTRTEA